MAVPIIGGGADRDRRSIPLATRTGQRIANVQGTSWPDSVMRERTRTHVRTFPNNALRSASSIYNCVGMVFASRRTAIDIGDVRWILEEDGYREIQRSDAQTGDVVLYIDRDGDPSHVGRVVTFSSEHLLEISALKILSQWGEDGEYLHAPDDVPPMFGQPREFWTDRRRVP